MFKKNKKKLLISDLLDYRLTTITFLILLIIIGLPLIKNINRRNQVNQEINNIKLEMSQTEKNNSDLQNLLKYLDSSQFTEEQARLNLGLKKDGEQVIVVKGIDQTSSDEIITKNLFDIPLISNNSTDLPISNYKKWITYFFN